MAQYKFNKDWSGGTYVPEGQGRAVSVVTFKKGDVIEGTQIRNTKNSEPPTFIEFQSKMGTVRVGYGGRAGSPLDEVSGTAGRPGSTGLRMGRLVPAVSKTSIIIGIVIVLIIIGVIYYIKRKKLAQ